MYNGKRQAACGIGGLIVAVFACGAWGQTSRPATATAGVADDAPRRIDLPCGGFYWLKTPPDYKPTDRAPLVICLHGTDDLASDSLRFWSSCGLTRGAVWAAPQASGRGWSDTDLPRLQETWADLRSRVGFDAQRVLLAGFSAGGAMTFHWLYREAFPATAVVTLANYLPPGVTAADVGKQKHVPVFYGVGMDDINHERMRAGLALLREQDVRVTLVRPPIGHALSADVGRTALAWFEELCRDAGRRRLEEAAAAIHRDKATGSGRAAVEAERLLAQARWHDAETVKRAEALLAQALAWGRGRLAEAERLAAEGRNDPQQGVNAAACLREIETAYAGASLAQEARARREKIEADPAVRQAAAEKDRRRREEEATALYLEMQRLVAAGKLDDARRICETITAGYGDTAIAQRAQNLLPKLPKKETP